MIRQKSPGNRQPVESRPAELIVVTPEAGQRQRLAQDLWRWRELFLALVRRDLRVRYKQTAIGAAWAVLQPLAMMAVFTVVFGYLARLPTGGIPYPVLVYPALLLWQLTSRALNEASASVVNNQALITKVYFPRIVLPISVIVSALVDFVVALALLFPLLAYFGLGIDWKVALAPVFILLGLLTAAGPAMWLAALHVRYRDVRHMLPLITQIWFFASPIFYPISLVPEAYRTVYSMNPMVGVIEGFRWTLIEGYPPPGWPAVAVSVVVAMLVLITGLRYFRRTEASFADEV